MMKAQSIHLLASVLAVSMRAQTASRFSEYTPYFHQPYNHVIEHQGLAHLLDYAILVRSTGQSSTISESSRAQGMQHATL